MSELTGIPYATWAHAGADIYNRNHQTEAALLTVLRGARFVLTCNQANVEYFGRILERAALAKVVYHPHGVDLERFEFREDVRPEDPQGVTTMLSVGRLSAAKGFHHAVEACAELARRGVDFRYRIIGEGPLRGQIETAIREHGLEGRVELLGYREQSELPAEYYAADLYLAPSVVGPKGARDGLPNVVLEAMASGSVVVGSNAVGIPEAVEDGETGVLTVAGDPVSIADGIERLMKDPDLRRHIRTRAVRLVHARYGRGQCMDRVAEIYGSRGDRVPEWNSSAPAVPVVAPSVRQNRG
jgi:glycosyltransferase involved in cell wall biosynthesis